MAHDGGGDGRRGEKQSTPAGVELVVGVRGGTVLLALPPSIDDSLHTQTTAFVGRGPTVTAHAIVK
jgi:hypothetical protein